MQSAIHYTGEVFPLPLKNIPPTQMHTQDTK